LIDPSLLPKVLHVRAMQAFMRITYLQRRGKTRLALAAAFLFFVLYSAPHRVHHLFENLPSSQAGDHETAPVAAASVGHEHGHDHHSGPESSDPGRSSAKSDCVALSIAQNSHLSFYQSLEIAYHPLKIKAQADPPVIAAYHLSRSPSSQRAPPPA
jgi:hypothetical protein